MKTHFLSISSISPLRIGQSMLAVALVFALTFVMQLIGSNLLGQGVIALLYLVPIGWCTVRWGQLAGVSAALAAALSFDYFFIPPFGTFNIGSIQGWLLLFIFIAAAILVVGRIQAILSDEQNRERKATFLYEIIASIANQQTSEGIERTIANQIQQKYLAELVRIQIDCQGNAAPLTIKTPSGTDVNNKRRPDRVFPILSGPALIGEIAVWKGLLPLPTAEDPMMQTILRQTSAALDRVKATEANSQASAHSQNEHIIS